MRLIPLRSRPVPADAMSHEFTSTARFYPQGAQPGEAAPAMEMAAGLEISVHSDPDAIESVWQAFERTALMSVYQRFDWVRAWCRHAAPGLGIEPALVLGLEHGRPLFLLPLGKRKSHLGVEVGWLGCSHVNIGMGLFDRSFAAMMDAETARHLMAEIVRAVEGADYFALRNQPASWQAVTNPLALLGGRAEDQPVLSIPLATSITEMLAGSPGARKRKKLRWQENALAPVGGYRFIRAETVAEGMRIFETFLRQKEAQFARSGIDNVFADPGTIAFFKSVIRRSSAEAEPLIELFAIEIAGEIRATFAGGIDHGRLHGYFSGISLDEYQRISPGELLLFNLVKESCERGLSVLDLGVGDERYKSSWQPVREQQFAFFLPASLRGRLAVAWLAALQAARVRIRRSRTAWNVVKKGRRWAASWRGKPSPKADAED